MSNKQTRKSGTAPSTEGGGRVVFSNRIGCRPARVIKRFKEPSKTDTSHTQEVNINRIMARFVRTGQLDPQHMRKGGSYGDFSNVEEYQDSLNRVREAREDFDALPSNVRARFHNNPSELLAFCQSEDNRAEAVELGLIAAPDADAPETSTAAVEPRSAPAPTPTPTDGTKTP